MSYIYYGPMGKPDAQIVNPGVFFVWDHAKTPGCADTTAAGNAAQTASPTVRAFCLSLHRRRRRQSLPDPP